MRSMLSVVIMLLSNYASAYDVWFNSNDPNFIKEIVQNKNKNALKGVKVYKMLSQNIMYSSDKELKEFFKFAKDNRIQLALESPVLVSDRQGRGHKVEGFSSEGLMPAVLKKIKINGGNLNFFSIDETFYYSILYKGENSVGYSLTKYQEEMIRRLKIVRSYFPNAVIGDIEPFTQIENANLLSSYFDALDNIDKVVNIDYIHYDVLWQANWPLTLRKLRDIANKRNLKLGVIFNASGKIYSNNTWISLAKANIEKVTSSGIYFDHAIVQGWGKYPNKTFPRADVDSQLNMVDFIHKSLK